MHSKSFKVLMALLMMGVIVVQITRPIAAGQGNGDLRFTEGGAPHHSTSSPLLLKSPPEVAVQSYPECPHGYYDKRGPFTEVPASEPITDIPEFHDCQRFIIAPTADPETWRFGGLYAIFASSWLDSLVVLMGGRSLEDETAHYRLAVTAATIYSYDDSRYGPLGIQPGFNCLYLSAVGEWRATVLPVTDAEECMQHRNPADLRGTSLEVRRTRVKAIGDGDYPPVARWDWDPARAEQYIGVKCGIAWCEIGANGFQTSQAHTRQIQRTTDATSPLGLLWLKLFKSSLLRQQRVWRVKGWYDEQHLAIPDASGKIRPGAARGTVVPHPDLSTYRNEKAFSGTWKVVAYFLIDQPSLAYQGKLLLTPQREARTTLALCKGTANACGVTNPPPPRTQEEWWGGWLKDSWWGKVASSDGQVLYRRVVRRKHPEEVRGRVPATARWRWHPFDEEIWVYCPQGCCEATE